MTTLKIALLVGVLGAAFAVGLAYAVAAIQGASPTQDELLRHAIVAFGVGTAAIMVVRRRPAA